MNLAAAKTRLVFLPVLALGTAFIIGYAFLYWLFYIRLAIVPLKEDIVQYWIPGGLSLVLVFIIIRPRVHILKLDKDNGRIRTLYYMVAAAAFCIPTIVALSYLESATGKLTSLKSVDEIAQKPATKYYTISDYAINKEAVGIDSRVGYSGKNNEYLNFDIYVAVPMAAGHGDTRQLCSDFLSVKYHRQISSRLSAEEREMKWSNFWDESFAEFNDNPIHFSYLERTGNTGDRDHLITAAKKSELYRAGSPIVILQPVDTPFGNRNGNKLGYFFLALGIGFMVWFIMIIIPGLHEDKAKNFVSANMADIKRQINEGYAMLKPKKGFAATPVLVMLNVLIFLVMIFAGLGFFEFETKALIPIGAIYKPAIQNGEWWRLLTGMFLHGGLLHLFMNMISLYIAGLLLEAVIGTKKFITGYLLSGIAAGLVSLWWHEKPVVAVGASGAIFGLYGIMLSLIFLKVFSASFNRVLLVLLACTAGYSLLIGFLSEGVDNSAHVGGLLSGLVLGFVFGSSIKRQNEDQSLRTE